MASGLSRRSKQVDAAAEKFTEKTVRVDGVPVVLYSLDGVHWGSDKKLLLAWQKGRRKTMDDLKNQWRKGTSRRVLNLEEEKK